MPDFNLLTPHLKVLNESFSDGYLADWWDLFTEIDYATPFQSPVWIASWWKYFGNQDLRVLTYRVNDRLAGIAPLFIYTDSQGIRRLTFVASGISDYLDILILRNHEDEFLSELMMFIESTSSEWDVCELQELKSDSPFLRFVTAQNRSTHLEPQSICPVLTLPSCRESEERFYSTSNYKKVLYYRRRFQKAAALTIEDVDSENLTDYFEALFSLHTARWKDQGSEGVLQSSQIQSFHMEVGRFFYEKNILRMYALKMDSKIVGIYYGFTWKKRAYFYLSGFESEIKHLNPGSLLIGHAIDCAISEGLTEFDFLRGEESYKYQWGAVNRINHRLMVDHGAKCRSQHCEN